MSLFQPCKGKKSVDVVKGKLLLRFKVFFVGFSQGSIVKRILVKPVGTARLVFSRYCLVIAVFFPCFFYFGSFVFAQVQLETGNSISMCDTFGKKAVHDYVGVPFALQVGKRNNDAGESTKILRSSIVEVADSSFLSIPAFGEVVASKSSDKSSGEDSERKISGFDWHSFFAGFWPALVGSFIGVLIIRLKS